ncbi:hypothetical protein EDB89DRAFT_1913700 [Lactarius sanguifluus]|nr:hypothetical protein EDB89DRAFT_1913700 [Lactarius sanguifluus]
MLEAQLSDVVLLIRDIYNAAEGYCSWLDEEVHRGKAQGKWIVSALYNIEQVASSKLVTFWIVLLLVLLFSELPVLHCVRRARTIHNTRAERRRRWIRCESKGGIENKDRSKEEMGRRIREQA